MDEVGILGWYAENKGWFFSGAGIFFAAGILFFIKKGALATLWEAVDSRMDRNNEKSSKVGDATSGVIEASANIFEIESYWGYRPAAHENMRAELHSASKRIFIAGGGLTTIVNVIKDPSFIEQVAKRINKNPDFSFTVVMDFDNAYSNSERGREGRAEKIISRSIDLREFHEQLSEMVSTKLKRPLVDFRKYNDTVTPRHFLLAVDENIYIGSYLSHLEGQYSYLIKINNKMDGVLYPLLNSEIEYVQQNSTAHPLS